MNVVFRADASVAIGSGHIMRCLTLAAVLRQQGHDCHFVCREHPGHLLDVIAKQGFSVAILPASDRLPEIHPTAHAAWLGSTQQQDAAACIPILQAAACDWLVVDHYALDATWEQALRPHCRRIMVIDDLADRTHDCDVLLDQTLGRSAQDYAAWVPATCRLLTGSQYALLRPEFAQWRTQSLQYRRAHSGGLQQLFINMGGVDKDNHTGRVLAALAAAAHRLPENMSLTVVMGATAPHLAAVQQQAQTLPWPVAVRVNAHNMAELMSQADLAIGAAGSSAWERCCLGLPSVMVVLADNQHSIAHQLQAAGAADWLDADSPHFDQELVAVLQADAASRAKRSRRAAALVDGEGAARVAAAIAPHTATHGTLRPLTEADVDTILAWRNHPQIRCWMFHSDEIAREQHWQWYRRQSTNPDAHLCLFDNGTAQGFVHFNHLGGQVYEWGFYLSPDSPPGNGRHLGRAALDYAFNALGAHKIQARVLACNTRSLALHHKLHFSQEGCLKQPCDDGINYWDVIEFGLSTENNLTENTDEAKPLTD